MVSRPLDVPVVLARVGPDAPPTHAVVRPRLERMLDSDAQVVAITAPAGYGKSALVATWVAARPHLSIAWASLDGEVTAVLFWQRLVDAIARVVPEVDEVAAIVSEASVADRSQLAALVHILHERRLVVVLDDLQRAGEASIRDDLALLVERCAPHLRVVTTGRTDPPLPMARWHAEGRAVELRADDLSFTTAEAIELLAPLGVMSSGHEHDPDEVERSVARLVQYTEGWAIGLLLGALSRDRVDAAAEAADAALASGRQLADYLVDELLDRLPPELATFVLEMSVPPWFDIELLQEMTGHEQAVSRYGALVRTNPFIIELDGGSLRFHHLIRALLRAELRWRFPERWVELHRAAAAVMRRRQRVDVAIELLLAVGDIDACVDLIAAPVLAMMDAGKLREVTRWFQLLPPVEPTDPVRVANYALALTVAGRPDLAEQQAARMGELIRSHPSDDPAEVRRLNAMRTLTLATVLTAAGRSRASASLLSELIAADGDRVASDQLDARLSSQVVRLSLQLGQLDVAERWIPEVERHRSTVVAQVHGPALRAWWWLAQGRADRALSAVEPSIAAAAAMGVRPHPAAADADIAHGFALLAQLRVRETGEAIERLDADADVLSFPFFLLRRWPLMMQFRALDEGWEAAADLSLSWSTSNFPGRGGDLVDLLAAVQARALIGSGRVGEAAERIDLLPASRERSLLRARIAAARGDVRSVERDLVGHDGWPVPERVEALLVLASGADPASASALLREAVDIARPGRWWAPFALEVGVVPRLLDELRPDDLPAALAPWRASARRTPRPPAARLALLDPITAREAAVLELLPSHLTYQAIGAELYVSVNTVKTYVSGIYRKLGVSSRGEAVRAARAAGLLSD